GEDLRGFTRRMTREVARLLDEEATTWWEAMRRAPDTSGTAGTPLSRPGRSRAAAAPAPWRRGGGGTEPADRRGAASPRGEPAACRRPSGARAAQRGP